MGDPGWKNSGLSADGAEADALSGDGGEGRSREDALVAARVMQRYEERLAAYQAGDFDDLVVLPMKLLERDAEVRDAWRERLRYILVDEYQDTNGVQYEMLKLLAGERGAFTAVGDDDQSIYGWRGATIDNLRRLPVDYPKLKVIPLEQNYRSTGSILAAANAVIANNPKLFEKKLWSDFGAGDPVAIVECDDEVHEADRAVSRIESLRCERLGVQGHRRALSRQPPGARLRAGAAEGGIPYKVSGGQSFFDRAEIRDLCAWLRLIVNPDDDPAFLRAVTSPKRGIGHQTLAALGTFASKLEVEPLRGALRRDAGRVAVEPRRRRAARVRPLRERPAGARRRDHRRAGREGAAARWLKDIGYEEHLHDGEDSPPLAAARWNNVLEFIDWMARRCGGQGSAATGDEEPATSVLAVAQTISVIISLAERSDEQDVVTLSTLHAAKGLEWPHVVLASVNEGLLPFTNEDDEAGAAARLEEERRLMYVGITRARATLAVGVLRRRKRGRQAQAALPSRFIAEMKLHEAKTVEDPRAQLKALRGGRSRASAAADHGRPEGRPRRSHALEEPRVAPAHLELFGVAAHRDELAAAQVARDAGDHPRVDERRAVDLPEGLGIELVDELLDRLSDQRLDRRRLHARVLLVGDEEEHVLDRDHLDRRADGGLDPLQLRRRAGVHLRREALQQLLHAGRVGRLVARTVGEALSDAVDRELQARPLGRLEDVVDDALLEGLDRVLVVGGDEDDLAAVPGLRARGRRRRRPRRPAAARSRAPPRCRSCRACGCRGRRCRDDALR